MGLRERLRVAGLVDRTHVPEDGEALEFAVRSGDREFQLNPEAGPAPGLQKWLVNQIAKVMYAIRTRYPLLG